MSIIISNASPLIALSSIERLQILAWKKGLIDKPVKELQELRLKGFWISDSLMAKIRNEIEG